MVIRQKDRYTVDSVISELKQLLKQEIPQEYKDWARDGITYVERNPEADVLDFPNNIFGYIRKTPMPKSVRDLVEGIYNEAIEKGSGMAACNLGALYYTGQIGEQSYEKAMDLYEIAADTGDEQAIENLGYCYYYGRDCEINYRKAFECFAKGAFQGKVTSLYKIADMYKNGYYVSQDPSVAYRIYSHCLDLTVANEDAAREAGADIYVRLADCFLNAIGTEQDTLKALFWAQRAEYEFRIRQADSNPFAKHGIEWAVDLTSRCRNILDGNANMVQPS